jgi:hypothetical protein
MWPFDTGAIMMVMIFAIPIVAIAGGITAGIVKTLGNQRLIELAQRERIAAIERGIDLGKLPPPPAPVDESDWVGRPSSPRQRAQGLMIAGLITTAAGIGVSAMLVLLDPSREHNAWAVGLVPAFIGVALLISAWLVRPRNGDSAPRP